MPPYPGGHRRHQRNRPGRDGHHVVAAGRVPAHRIHGRHRRPLHVVVRIHGFVRDRGLAAGVVHPDADADARASSRCSPSTRATQSTARRIRASSASWIATTRGCSSGPWRIASRWWRSAWPWCSARFRSSCWWARASCRPTTAPSFKSPFARRKELRWPPPSPSPSASRAIFAGIAGRDRDADFGRQLDRRLWRSSSSGASNSASIYVKLVPRDDRKDTPGSTDRDARANF